MQTRAVQGMLDFDFLCRRETPSVAAIVFPFGSAHYLKFYYGTKEIMIPVVPSVAEAAEKHADASVFINFASFRSAYSSTMEALECPQFRTIAIIAEGIPERLTCQVIQAARSKGVLLVGPATVGGVIPGCFRIGNTGGMIDNIIASKLYRPGSVAYVSKSGGMSNELNNIMARHTDGVCEGIAIGGDRYPGSRFLDHVLRYQANPGVQMIVLLGEVGGVDEYEVCKAIKDGRVTKPVVAWCIGTCARIFPFEVQFGHAGALANSAAQTAEAKNRALAEAGAIVPENFNDFVTKIGETYASLVRSGTVRIVDERAPPALPMDFNWAKQLGLVRKPAAFVSSVSDERGDELHYAGVPISEVIGSSMGVGGTLSLLWFQQRLPEYAARFIELVLVVTADHGPAVSGAHNTIVTARAGKDLVSSLVSGLLTIGPRFGGALDEAASMFSQAVDAGTAPPDFVRNMRKANKLIMGIGHRVKSIHNPDKRVTLVVEYARKHFPATTVLDYGLEVEKVTTQKKPNLILNVDGAIACAFVDMLRGCGVFSKSEADEHIKNGCLNGLFVLGRSIGFIGHFLDQKRLKQGLYRHPWDDIAYLEPQQ
jgi:ATP citrate (pro-S)-lyase